MLWPDGEFAGVMFFFFYKIYLRKNIFLRRCLITHNLLYGVRLLQSHLDAPVPLQWRHVIQVSDLHEGFVKVMQLQNTGQQEKTRNQNTGEEF